MKKVLQKTMLVLAAVMVCATGIKQEAKAATTTEVTLNEDLSGERVMEVVLTKSNKEWYLKGKNGKTFLNQIKKKCPSQLSYEVKNYEGGYKFTYKLSFDSLEDYEDKVLHLLEDYTSEEALVTLDLGEAPFSAGIQYQENFTSKEILHYFEDAVNEMDFVSYWGISDTFSEESETLIYAGETYENETYWGSNISVQQLESFYVSYLGIYNMSVTTDKIDRGVRFYFSKSMNELTDDIKEYLESSLPDGATGEWIDVDEYNCYYDVSLGEMSLSDLEAAMNSLLHSEDTKIVVENAQGEDKFSTGVSVKEHVNVEAFMKEFEDSGDYVYYNGPIVRYGYAKDITASYDSESTYISADEEKSEETVSSNGGYSDTYDDVNYYYDVFALSADFVTDVVQNYTPDGAVVTTRLGKTEKELERTVEFTYEDVPDESILSAMGENFKAVKDFDITTGTTKDGFTVTVKGDDDDIEKFTTDVIGFGCEVRYSVDKLMLGAKKEFSYKETLTPYYVVNDLSKVKSVVILADDEKLEKDSRYDRYEKDDNTYEQDYDEDDSEIEWKLEGESFTLQGYIMMAAVAVVVIIIVVVVVAIIRKRR